MTVTTNPDYCPTCHKYIYAHRPPHRCPPRWLVSINEDACPGYGEPDACKPPDDKNNWRVVWSIDESDAAEQAAQQDNENNEYYMMSKTYPVWVRPFPWRDGDVVKRFNVLAEPSVYYSVNEVET